MNSTILCATVISIVTVVIYIIITQRMRVIETFVTTQSFNDATRDAIYDFPNDFVIRKILYTYLKKNKNCQVGDEKMYYKILIQSIQNYISAELYTSFNRIPPKNELLTLDSIEYRRYKKIMENLPGCYELIKDYLHRRPSDLKPEEIAHTVLDTVEEDITAFSEKYFPKMFLHHTLTNKVPIEPRQNTHRTNIFAKTMLSRNKMKQELLYGVGLLGHSLTTHPIDTNIIDPQHQSNLNAVISAPKVVRPKLTRHYTPRVISGPTFKKSKENETVVPVHATNNQTAPSIHPNTQYSLPGTGGDRTNNSEVSTMGPIYGMELTTPSSDDTYAAYNTRNLKNALHTSAKQRSRPLLIKRGLFDIIAE